MTDTDTLAKEIVKTALGIDWRDTESQARRVAEHAADEVERLRAERGGGGRYGRRFNWLRLNARKKPIKLLL